MGLLRRLRRGPPAASTPDNQRDVVSMYADLRASVLGLDPETVGIGPTGTLPHVWGLVMDWSLDRAVATIVSLADGTTSMYLSPGGGSIGAGAHVGPANASIKALQIAESMFEDFPLVRTAPLPPPTRTALTLLTFAGLRRIEEENAKFEQGTARMSAVANAMQEVIHEIRLTEDSNRD